MFKGGRHIQSENEGLIQGGSHRCLKGGLYSVSVAHSCEKRGIGRF